MSDNLDCIQDLQEFMDKAVEGVIYFTTGSHLKSSELSPKVIEALTNSFSQLKQKVLWKWEGEPMPNKPDNVMLAPWFPQNSILSNVSKNLVLFY